ncbi:MAG: hypothetical protein KGL39_56765 [Patescibacteria group bacterium]|nr:hypothetical protein [Patescibacteria group bacterium]
MHRATLVIPGTPPSFNAIGFRSHWAVGRRHKQQWQRFLAIALMEQRVPRGLEVVSATAELRFRQRRRRDEGNFRVIIEKALGDALVEGGWLVDDTAEQFHFGAVQIMAPAPAAETLVQITWSRPS